MTDQVLYRKHGVKSNKFCGIYNEKNQNIKKLSSLKYQNSEEMYNSMCTKSLHKYLLLGLYLYHSCVLWLVLKLIYWIEKLKQQFLDLNDFSIKKVQYFLDLYLKILSYVQTMLQMKQNVKITIRSGIICFWWRILDFQFSIYLISHVVPFKVTSINENLSLWSTYNTYKYCYLR